MAYGPNTGSFGLFCDKANITETSINNCLPKLNSGPKNGVVFELNQYRIAQGVCWSDFYNWINQLCDDTTNLCVLPTFKVYVGRMEKKVSKLKRNKQHKEIQLLMDEPFCRKKKEPATTDYLAGPLVKSSSNACSAFDFQVLQDVNKKLVTELNVTESALEAQKEETEKLCEKFSHLKVQNVKKRIKRRDDKIATCKMQIKVLEQEVGKPSEIIEQFEKDCQLLQQKKEQHRVKSYRLSKKAEKAEVDINEIHSKFVQLESGCNSKIKSLENEITQMHAIMDEKEMATEQLHERLNELDMKLLKTKEHKQLYLDNVRECCLELLSLNVGI